jgi:hypothetical protein
MDLGKARRAGIFIEVEVWASAITQNGCHLGMPPILGLKSHN